ncbi:glycoside hydrolase family 71/99-like protein [Flavobacterium aquicola]|uniref:Glycosyl hydrolase family 99 n=1 Tax=Flavobacterium aquicola TaxID=1682742 RepID=A0A3E0ERW9_9FLAO|nr:glycoside hydrolase family 71/99-like protein [Flavobacterium aquicola]REH00130.1 glycosyl hydrolase family 99 [Flavobacterium aquicola]
MNKYITLFCIGIINLAVTSSCSGDDKKSDTSTPPVTETFDPVPVEKTNSTKIYMHYMAWFETNESSTDHKWGYHWTMANKNPNNADANGRREIASYYYPLIGPYHSGDKEVIENHLLMMKYAGIDGVLIDWYGTYDLNDYKMVKENTEQLIAMLDKVGLEYAIVYEDRFLKNIVDAGLAPTVTSAAKTDLSYMQSHYFGDSNYIKINSKPLLMNFGPIILTTADEWTNVFSGLSTKPAFLTLWDHSSKAGTNASGEYAWVYKDNTYLSNFYTNTLPKLSVGMGGAYPGFHDFYKDGGAGDDIGWTIDHNNGATLDETLAMAKSAKVNYLQLITWNDFGEGTMIEPTKEFGYSYVEKIKTFAGVKNTSSSFSEISKLYNLRKEKKGNTEAQKKLDKVFGYFVSMQPDKAKQLLNEVK